MLRNSGTTNQSHQYPAFNRTVPDPLFGEKQETGLCKSNLLIVDKMIQSGDYERALVSLSSLATQESNKIGSKDVQRRLDIATFKVKIIKTLIMNAPTMAYVGETEQADEVAPQTPAP